MTDVEILMVVAQAQIDGTNTLDGLRAQLNSDEMNRLFSMKRRGQVQYVNVLENNTLITRVIIPDSQ